EELLPGQDWDLEIKRAMRESDFCILCMSHISVAKRGYLQQEIQRALDIVKEYPEGAIYLIPARLDECQIPQTVSRRQWVDLFEAGGMARLLKALQFEAARREIGVLINAGVRNLIVRLQAAAKSLSFCLASLRNGTHQLS